MINEQMADTHDLTIGEIGRSVSRIESALTHLSGQVQMSIAPVSELKVRVERAETDINGIGTKLVTLDDKIDAVKTRVNIASGGLSVLAFLSSMIPWPWKTR
jgi:hypothetical protein